MLHKFEIFFTGKRKLNGTDIQYSIEDEETDSMNKPLKEYMDGGGDTPGMITNTFFLVTSFPKNVVLKPRSSSLCPQLFQKAFHFGELIFQKQKIPQKK